ncbi:hypothetical protein AVEN_222870-1 [Araneus ventricosus]|uniref:Uncharacterized protein n=1 Tax=Araneus ventricosus TaxID=182803 RepID=A0A4Y2T6Q9_ARAVE|nr:hypothetical protein AVEN_222870-1 [Araneus ventricosus]
MMRNFHCKEVERGHSDDAPFSFCKRSRVLRRCSIFIAGQGHSDDTPFFCKKSTPDDAPHFHAKVIQMMRCIFIARSRSHSDDTPFSLRRGQGFTPDEYSIALQEEVEGYSIDDAFSFARGWGMFRCSILLKPPFSFTEVIQMMLHFPLQRFKGSSR